jgi:hypothetical protein
MSATESPSEFGTGGPATPAGPAPVVRLSAEQRKVLAQLCQVHEGILGPRQVVRRFAVYTAVAVACGVLVLNITDFAAAGYFSVGLMGGALLREVKTLMVFSRLWPVYEAIIDWPRAFHLLKAADGSEGDREVLHEA